MLKREPDRANDEHYGRCPARTCDGPCSCDRIAQAVEDMKQKLTEDWEQTGAKIRHGETRNRQEEFERWVIDIMARLAVG